MRARLVRELVEAQRHVEGGGVIDIVKRDDELRVVNAVDHALRGGLLLLVVRAARARARHRPHRDDVVWGELVSRQRRRLRDAAAAVVDQRQQRLPEKAAVHVRAAQRQQTPPARLHQLWPIAAPQHAHTCRHHRAAPLRTWAPAVLYSESSSSARATSSPSSSSSCPWHCVTNSATLSSPPAARGAGALRL